MSEKKSPLVAEVVQDVDKKLVHRIIVGFIASHTDGDCEIPDHVNGPVAGVRAKVSDYLTDSDLLAARKEGKALKRAKDKEAQELQKKLALAMRMKKEEMED